jgi:hypothetical protein
MSMFKDSTGAVSMTRVCMFFIVATVCLVYILQNAVSMFHGGGLISMGYPEISALGLVFGAKIGQNITENMATTPAAAEQPAQIGRAHV